jgi:hypothetical protein
MLRPLADQDRMLRTVAAVHTKKYSADYGGVPDVIATVCPDNQNSW